MPFYDPHEDKEFQDKASGRKEDVRWRLNYSGLLSIGVFGVGILIWVLFIMYVSRS